MSLRRSVLAVRSCIDKAMPIQAVVHAAHPFVHRLNCAS